MRRGKEYNCSSITFLVPTTSTIGRPKNIYMKDTNDSVCMFFYSQLLSYSLYADKVVYTWKVIVNKDMSVLFAVY